MNFNYDLATWINYFIGALICCFGMALTGKVLLYYKIKNIKWYMYIFTIFLSICILLNSLLFDNIFKIFLTIIFFILMYKIIYHQNIIKSLLYSIASYIIFIISEITVSSVMALIAITAKMPILQDYVKLISINLIISLVALLYSFLFRKYINRIVNKISNYSIIYVVILGVIAIFGMATALFTFAANNCKIDYKLVLNIITFVGFFILTIVLLRQYLKNKEINDKYHLLEDYLKTSAELIEKYSSTTHKYKNNLIAIKGYLKSDIKKANNYIDNLLENYDYKKYNWFSKINYIQIDAIRYLVYYKLSKAETKSLKINVDVSDEIKKYNNDLITLKEGNILLEIIGEFFDNALYASNESKLKELNLMIFSEEDNLNFIISNTYKGNIDLSMISKNGYSTKGKNHGLGLYDIDKTINKNKWISVKYEILNDYFVVRLCLNFNKINKEKRLF